MKSITNMIPTRKTLHKTDDNIMENDLNKFYSRFESHNFSLEWDNVIDNITVDDCVSRIDITPRLARLF